MAENGAVLYKPLGLLAELTHRCPLGCPYCSNPLALDPRGSELDTQTWARVFAEAAALGVLQVHLSGGEPGARRVRGARSISAAAAARRSRSPVTPARPTRSAISRHATRMSPRWRLCSTTRPTPTGGCEFRRSRRATVLAMETVPNCRAYTDRPVLGAHQSRLILFQMTNPDNVSLILGEAAPNRFPTRSRG